MDIKTNKMHLQKMKNAGINWVRMDVTQPLDNSQKAFKEAHDLGLKVIGVVTSKRMLRGLGFGTKNYLPGSNWGSKWKKSVEEVANLFDPYIEIWQIDNELNHPWHNLVPSMNTQLALDIIESGADAIRKINSEAELAINLFYELKGPFHLPGIPIIRDNSFILRFKDRLENKIDILALDIYRGTWHVGGPESYSEDVMRYRKLWGGDVMIMETGFCTGLFGRSEADQANYVRQVFERLDNYICKVPWFRGIVWYVFRSSHAGIPCENYFGLHRDDGFTEKTAWREFTEKVKKYNQYGKILGITYHY
jgi:hypothetical protein